jgi:hypothetical protein
VTKTGIPKMGAKWRQNYVQISQGGKRDLGRESKRIRAGLLPFTYIGKVDPSSIEKSTYL